MVWFGLGWVRFGLWGENGVEGEKRREGRGINEAAPRVAYFEEEGRVNG